jgi:hypothetical protein
MVLTRYGLELYPSALASIAAARITELKSVRVCRPCRLPFPRPHACLVIGGMTQCLGSMRIRKFISAMA